MAQCVWAMLMGAASGGCTSANPPVGVSRAQQDVSTRSVKREITVFVRVDDIFMKESSIEPQEIDAFLKVAEKHQGRVVLATIPNRLLQKTNADGEMSDQLRGYVRRGHQVFQHGFDHRCPFTGDTGLEFFQPGIKEGYTKEQRIEKIREGKQILEAVIGRRVTGYVGPGNDGLYIEEDLASLADLGFLWLPDFESPATFMDGSTGRFVNGLDYTWALTEETYRQKLNEAKENFLQTIREHDLWAIKFHDHFTRKNYNHGIVVRWFDELLTWLHSHPDLHVVCRTYDEFYAIHHPDFSAGF